MNKNKAIILPVKFILNLAKKREKVCIWLFENTSMKIEGVLTGFDNFLNVTLIDAEEVYVKTNSRIKIGNILLKGENISVISKCEN